MEQNNTLRGEVSEKKVLRQQSIKKLKIQKEMREKLKDYEIKALKKNSGESQKEFLSEKMTLWMSDSNLQKLEVIKLLILKTKQEKLEVFATEIGIELQKTQNLCKRYRELISAQEENRGNDIAIAKENIEATREGLLERGISNSKVGKFCRKCKKVAQLEV